MSEQPQEWTQAESVWKQITDLADTLEEGIADLNDDTRFIRIIDVALTKAHQDGRNYEIKLMQEGRRTK